MFYTAEDGSLNIKAFIDNETIWLTQKQMAELFDVKIPAISKHIQNIFNEEELNSESVVSKMEITADDGKSYNTNFYNLDVIIAVGYRVNSYKATKFRQWATTILKEYLIKGFAMDDERLKQGKNLFGKDYFDELLERIREIRASERRFYQKITDIYSEYSIDYDAKSPTTKEFFAHAQNKLEYAVTTMTSAEIIETRANYNLDNMGLTTWKNQKKDGRITKKDVTIAKNYLTEEEISNLNRLVNMFLDYVENLAKKQQTMKMEDWANKLNDFLKFNEYEILQNYGKISKDFADKLAVDEYNKFKEIQEESYKSDFDKIVEKTKSTPPEM